MEKQVSSHPDPLDLHLPPAENPSEPVLVYEFQDPTFGRKLLTRIGVLMSFHGAGGATSWLHHDMSSYRVILTAYGTIEVHAQGMHGSIRIMLGTTTHIVADMYGFQMTLKPQSSNQHDPTRRILHFVRDAVTLDHGHVPEAFARLAGES